MPPRRDPWLIGLSLLLLGLYVALALQRPAGEGWGRGWNLIAFLIIASPFGLLAGGLAAWRSGKNAGAWRRLARGLCLLGFAFPLICLLVLRWKS